MLRSRLMFVIGAVVLVLCFAQAQTWEGPSPRGTIQQAQESFEHKQVATSAKLEAPSSDNAIKWTDVAIVVLTGGLVLAALLQFGAALLQWNAMVRQERQMRRTIVEARRASNRQSRDVKEQIALARAEFVSTHRPKIILREAIIGSVMEEQPITVIMTFANVGETHGKIVRSIVDLEIINSKFERLYLLSSVERFNEIGDLELAPGASRLVGFDQLQKRDRSSTPPVWKAAMFQQKSEYRPNPDNPALHHVVCYRDHMIHLVGQFLYEDAQGLLRRTAFRRELIPERQRFYRLQDEPDLDYAD